jgi:transcriptional regulator with XRE-family HTH domain
MIMDKKQQLWKSLEDKEYRRAFSADVGTGLAFQVRRLREKARWTQEQLAQRLRKPQPQISQWENPDYGRYSLSTLKQLAAAFDVALIVRFAPFSELVDWTANLTPERLAPLSFGEELEQSHGAAHAGSKAPAGLDSNAAATFITTSNYGDALRSAAGIIGGEGYRIEQRVLEALSVTRQETEPKPTEPSERREFALAA